MELSSHSSRDCANKASIDTQKGIPKDIEKSFLICMKEKLMRIKDLFKNENENNEQKIKNQNIENFNKAMYSINKIIQNYMKFKEKSMIQYDNILKSYEQKIRVLHENIFFLGLKLEVADKKIKELKVKEKEYELLKQHTGLIVEKGKVINYRRKDNEILILRKENSTLKDIIKRQQRELNSRYKIEQQKKAKVNYFSSKKKTQKIALKLHSPYMNKSNKSDFQIYCHCNSRPSPKIKNSFKNVKLYFPKKSKSYKKEYNIRKIFCLKSKNNKLKIIPKNNHKIIYKNPYGINCSLYQSYNNYSKMDKKYFKHHIKSNTNVATISSYATKLKKKDNSLSKKLNDNNSINKKTKINDSYISKKYQTNNNSIFHSLIPNTKRKKKSKLNYYFNWKKDDIYKSFNSFIK